MLTIIAILLCVYFTPTVIGLINRHPHLSQIFITNLFLGWSIIFWVVSFRTAMGWDQIGKSPDETNG
jgi:hypothetical protein